MMRSSKSIPLFVTALVLLPVWGRSEPAATPSIDPKVTRVAILPVQDKSGREGKERAQFTEAAMATLRTRFQKEGFLVMESAEIDAAARELQMDPADPDLRTREHLAQLANRLGARFVVSAAVLLVDSRMQVGWFTSRKQGTATVELAIYDAQGGQFTVRDTYRATKKGSALF